MKPRVKRAEPSGRIPGSARAHSSLVAACRTLLTLRKIPNAAINQRPTLTGKGYRTPGATPGTWDIVACLPPDPRAFGPQESGRCLWVECKSSLRATTSSAQRRFSDEWTAAGALCWVIRDIAELDAKLTEIRERR